MYLLIVYLRILIHLYIYLYLYIERDIDVQVEESWCAYLVLCDNGLKSIMAQHVLTYLAVLARA